MKLSETVEILKKENLAVSFSGDCDFEKITCDSRQAGKDTLFFVKGANFKEEYFTAAVKDGICGYIAEKEYSKDLPHVIVSDVRLAMPLLAKAF